jgi:glucose/arabinose dehydrogenase
VDLDVYTGQEDGLLGLALDPDFEQNGWIYLFHSPPGEELNRVSRFTYENENIDTGTEVQIIDIHTQRETCCHAAGHLEFGPEGNLYVATGDDTNPFQSGGSTPIDEREGREPFDAQRSSANTADLRGKILRITLHEDGSYSVPSDNLFTAERGYGDELDQGLVREEIYVMGCRNPYKYDLDSETGALWYSDYGPDAGSWSDARGPVGIVELNRITDPVNSGWPYDTGDNYPYRDYDFATQESGDLFDPANPTNESPNNTGLTELPASDPATIWYPQSWSSYVNDAPDYIDLPKGDKSTWPQIPEGGAPMAGVVYRRPDDAGADALPEYYDGKHFYMSFNRGYAKYVTFDDDGEVVEIEPFMPDAQFGAAFDLAVAPDGSLYHLDFNGSVSRITHSEETVSSEEETMVTGHYGLNAGGETVTVDGIDFVDGTDTGIENVSVTAEGGVGVASTGDSIANTEHDALYQTEFFGQDLSFEVAIANGTYDVILHFAETFWGEDGARVFDVAVQGETVRQGLDIHAEVGHDASLVEEVTEVEVTDGTLTISTTTSANESKVSAIEIRQRVRAPYGLNTGGGDVSIGGTGFISAENPSALYDASVSGSGVGSSATGDSIENTEHDALYQSEFYGTDLSFEIDIPNGTYDVRLHFAEIWWGPDNPAGDGGVGSRVFDVAVQGRTIRENLDIYDEVGPKAALVETASGVEVTDGTLTISMTTSADKSKISGIEIRRAADFELEGQVDGWVGTAPPEIEGVTNPDLSLEPGSEYTVRWRNMDGSGHNFNVEDASGTDVVTSELLFEQGHYQTVQFTATEDMAEYYCEPHSQTMRGDVALPTTSIERAVAGPDNKLTLSEIQNAINWWAEDTAVPGTGGKTLTLPKLQSLINAWAEDESVSGDP